MSQGVVVDAKRSTIEGVQVVEIRVDTGGGNIVTADHFDGAGDDALPLPGDYAALAEGDGAGNVEAVGCHDGKNAGAAAPGERRTYARAPDGAVVAEIWAKGNGDIAIRSIKAGGKINLNGVEIDQQGNLKAPGEVTAMSSTQGASVTLSRHIHPTGTGPSGTPQPGT